MAQITQDYEHLQVDAGGDKNQLSLASADTIPLFQKKKFLVK